MSINDSFIFDKVDIFVDGYAQVNLDGKFGIIDIFGKWFMNEKFNTICQMVLNDNTDISLSVSVDEKLKDDDIKIELNK